MLKVNHLTNEFVRVKPQTQPHDIIIVYQEGCNEHERGKCAAMHFLNQDSRINQVLNYLLTMPLAVLGRRIQ